MDSLTGLGYLPSYKKTSIVCIFFEIKNENSDKNKLIYPDINFVSCDELQNQLKSLSRLKTPLVLNFNGYTIDDKMIALLNSIPEIQYLSFAHCFFRCSLKDINTSKYFFGLTISSCTSDRDWLEVLNGIKNFHKLVWHSPLNDNDVPTLFSAQLNVEMLEINSAFSISALDKPFDNVVISPRLRLISIVNFSISDRDIAFLLSSVDIWTTVQFRKCNSIKRDLVLPENSQPAESSPPPRNKSEQEEIYDSPQDK
jgi:hypothetical protein